MEYRQGTKVDLDAFLEHRMAFVQTVAQVEDMDAFREKTRQVLATHQEDESFLIYLGEDQGELAVSCLACLYETVPLPTCPGGKNAEILGMFTSPGFRRQGYAEELLRRLLAELKGRGVERVLLIYTEEGFPLYQKLGFTKVENQMRLRL